MSGLHYSIKPDKTYFLTSTVEDWIDVFTRVNHKKLLIESLKHCQRERGLNSFAWCLMPSHLHMIANAEDGDLSGIMRDFKKYTSKKIVHQIIEEPESRRKWMLMRFEYIGKFNPKIKDYKFWQDGNHAVELYSENMTWQKINYIHQNPVVEEIVLREQDYLYSSARNYYDLPSVLDVKCLTPPVMTVDKKGFFRI